MADNAITINDHGLGDRLANVDARKFAEKAMHKAVLLVSEKGSEYPPPPSNSTYRRTGTLGRSITGKVESITKEVRGLVGSRVVYAPNVIGDKQAPIHAGRWVKLVDVAVSQIPQIESFFEDATKEIAEFLKNG